MPAVLLVLLHALPVVILDGGGASEAVQRKAHAAAVKVLEQQCALKVDGDFKTGRPRAPAFVGLRLHGAALEASFVVDGETVTTAASVEAALPAWAKKGWGGVRVPRGATVKVDGTVQEPRADVVSTTAGPHLVDVLTPDGAFLQRVEVEEGSRARLELSPPNVSAERRGFSVLRLTSYAAWMAGAATLLTAFIVGFTGRETASGQSPCTVGTRGCVTYAMAAEQSQRSAQLASTANVLLGTGLVLALAGAGLFTWDVLR